MEKKLKTNLSKVEKIILGIYIVYVLFAKLIFDKTLVSVIILIGIIILTSMKENNKSDTKYLIKEKLNLIVRHFFLLCILWNIVLGFTDGGLLFEDSLFNIVIYTILLIIFLLPFLGILKAISKIRKIETYTNVELYRELPENIEPAVIAYLMQDNILDKSDISATLLDLVRREYLIMEEDISNGFDDIARGILNKKLVINSKKNINELKEYERFLISWFSRTSENSQEINMNKLKNMLKDAEDSKKNYDRWEELVKKEADKLNFYDDKSKLSKLSKFSEKWAKKILMLSMYILAFVIIGIASENIVELPETFYIIVAIAYIIHIILSTLAIIIYNLRLPTEYLSQLGQENIRKWNGFIKFLKDYTLINERESKEIHIWEEYLVYGVAFGVAKETINNMNEAYALEKHIKD